MSKYSKDETMDRNRPGYGHANSWVTLINPIISSAVLLSALHKHPLAVAIGRTVMLKLDRGLA